MTFVITNVTTFVFTNVTTFVFTLSYKPKIYGVYTVSYKPKNIRCIYNVLQAKKIYGVYTMSYKPKNIRCIYSVLTKRIPVFVRLLNLLFGIIDLYKTEVLRMAGNADLNKANKAKKDEFYTQLEDIELEMKHG